MLRGTVFDIKEFAVHDGPGIRTTIFMKGCPLKCSWCHNPEGISPEPQTMRSPGRERTVGREYSSAELAALINSQADILRANEGGVTFSGGEPLLQADFVSEVIDSLDNLHVLLDTSGFGLQEQFRELASKSDLVHFDLKLIDPIAHRHYTGVSNDHILINLKLLNSMAVPFIARVPLIPGVTDSDENLRATASIVSPMANLLGVELLPYHPSAGGKYAACGMEFLPDYDETAPCSANTDIFSQAGLNVRIC